MLEGRLKIVGVAMLTLLIVAFAVLLLAPKGEVRHDGHPGPIVQPGDSALEVKADAALAAVSLKPVKAHKICSYYVHYHKYDGKTVAWKARNWSQSGPNQMRLNYYSRPAGSDTWTYRGYIICAA